MVFDKSYLHLLGCNDQKIYFLDITQSILALERFLYKKMVIIIEVYLEIDPKLVIR